VATRDVSLSFETEIEEVDPDLEITNLELRGMKQMGVGAILSLSEVFASVVGYVIL